MESLCSKGYGTCRIYLGLRAMRFLVFYLSLILAKGDDCARECREKMQIMVVMVQVLGFANLLSISRWECQYTVDRSFQLA
ncbi:unnamed protein product [Brassica rapa]|uniref:Uncharacterized protein n=2 Tax=Brassica TaxID=3705 RepID=A0A8D9D0M4_BRACM|nr:unnamed protein product [Brassica napus]CAG7864683.1 unnamed protein product [Brassica rapa]